MGERQQLKYFIYMRMTCCPFFGSNQGRCEILTNTLTTSQDFIGLHTNCCKSHVVTIRCDGMNTDEVLNSSQQSTPISLWATSTSLPYVTRLKRVGLQHLEEKIASKLTAWRENHVAMMGRKVIFKAGLTL